MILFVIPSVCLHFLCDVFCLRRPAQPSCIAVIMRWLGGCLAVHAAFCTWGCSERGVVCRAAVWPKPAHCWDAGLGRSLNPNHIPATVWGEKWLEVCRVGTGGQWRESTAVLSDIILSALAQAEHLWCAEHLHFCSLWHQLLADRHLETKEPG